MSKLTNVLEELKVQADPKMGSPEPIKKDDFVTAIQIISRQNRMFLWIAVVMLILIFLACFYFVLENRNNLTNVGIIFSVLGVSFTGLVAYMNSLWRQSVGIELAIAMADRLDQKALLAIINSLLKTFGNKK